MSELIYGHNPDTHIVAVHHAADNLMRVYVRSDDRTVTRDIEFFPFFLLSDASLIQDFPGKHWIKELSGGNFYRYLCAFQRWPDLWEAVRHILEKQNENSTTKVLNYADLRVLHLRADPVSQFLLQSGRTLFKDMRFEDLHRLQLDIETSWRHPSSRRRASRANDHIIMIALSDNRGWEYVIDGRKADERGILEQLVTIIQERDPDVIEGHNIYGFDLPVILSRCAQNGVELRIGRDGDPPRLIEGKTTDAASGDVSYEVPGRHVIDTLVLLKAYDSSNRRLESYGLKYAAQFFGVAPPDRTYIPGDQIWWYWEHDPEKLVRYALDDVREVRQLSELLSPSVFYLAQMVPMEYAALARSGSSAKIESLLIREYVRQKHSVPQPRAGMQQLGGYTDLFYTGVFGPVVHADVESLYPSIMVHDGVAPESDSLKVFPILLKHLTEMRLDAKKRMRGAQKGTEQSQLDALQSSYKILINSFYGYLGYPRGLFNDHAKADAVARKGQGILRMLMDEIRFRGGKVIEVDTDGIFFVPPAGIENPEEEEHFLGGTAKKLPGNMKLSIDGRYKKMLSYKKKNYALLGHDDKVGIRGSSLISRSIEAFGRRFMEECVQCLLQADVAALHALYLRYHAMITNREISIKDLARMETLRDTRERYEREVTEGKRNRTASYEAAISGGLQWRPGSRVTYYITGNSADLVEFRNCKLLENWDPNFPDENIPHYLKRLEEFSRKFEQFFVPQHFRAIFSLEGLFDFSPKGIAILANHLAHETDSRIEEEPVRFPIWLDVDGGVS